MTVHVLVPMEEGTVRGVQAFRTAKAAKSAEKRWLRGCGIHNEKERNAKSDWGTGIAVWECELPD